MSAGFSVATLNLFHYAAPPIWWYGVGDPRGGLAIPRHAPEGWAAKRAWLTALLREMDADLVGFQEVVSVADLAVLCRDAGYGAFFAAGEPAIETRDGEQVYTRPVQAVAARAPLAATALGAPANFAARAGLEPGWRFRRPPVWAEIETTAFGPLVVVCAHLKSWGVTIDEGPWAARSAPDMDAAARVREEAEAHARGHLASVRQRTAEAAALQHAALAAVAERPERPVVLMGDFNDAPRAPALRALTATASAALHGPELARCWRLYDAYDLAPPAQISARPATHADDGALDYVLVSAALDGDLAARGRVVEHRVFDSHLRDGAPPERASDHAAVRVRFEALAV